MSKYYRNYGAVKQLFKMSCWAASLEWWTKYMSPVKPVQSQLSLIYEARAKQYSPKVEPLDDNYGGMEIQHIETMLKRADLFGMSAARITTFDLTPEYMKAKLAKSPMFISYYEPSVGGAHANIIINCKTKSNGSASVRVMEPSTGQFLRRDIAYYYNNGDTIIGWLN